MLWLKWLMPAMSVLVTGYFCSSLGQNLASSFLTACIGAGIAIGQFVFLSPFITQNKIPLRSLGVCLFLFNALGTVGVIESSSVDTIQKTRVAKVEQDVALQRLAFASSEIESMSVKGSKMIDGQFQTEGKKLLSKKDMTELDRDKYLSDLKASLHDISPVSVLLSEFSKTQRLIFWLVLAVLFDLTGIGFFHIGKPEEAKAETKQVKSQQPKPATATELTIKSNGDYHQFKTSLINLEFGEYVVFNEVKAQLKIGAAKLQRYYQTAKQENLLEKEGNRWKVIQCEGLQNA